MQEPLGGASAPVRDGELIFLNGGGALGDLMRRHDWSASPLGPPATWPAILKTSVGMILPSAAQIVLFWGPELVALYNDSFAPTLGDKHPGALGRPAREYWSELWDDLEPLLRRVLEGGETVQAEDRPFYIERHGHPETVFFDISYSPVRDEEGAIRGVLCVVKETTEKVLSTERLRESEHRFHAMADCVDQMIWSTRADGFHDYYNKRWYDYTGVADGSTDGAGWNEMFHPEDRDRAWGAWRRSLETGEPYQIEYRLRHCSGQYRWVLGRAQPVRDETGSITRWYGTCTDIHDLKLAQQKLRESEERLQTLTDNLPGVVVYQVVTSADMSERRYVHVAASAEQVLGVRPEDAIADPNVLMGRIDPDQLPAVIEAERKAAAALETLDIEIVGRVSRGEIRTRIISRPRPLPDGRLVWDGMAIDITERRRQQQEAERTAALIGAVGAATPDLIFAKDLDFRILYANPATCETIGVPPERLIGMSNAEIASDAAEAAAFDANDRAVIEAGTTQVLEEVFTSPDGTKRYFRSAKTPMRNAKGEVIGLAGVSTDITDRVEAEEKLRESEARLRAIFEATPECIKIVAPDGSLMQMNHAGLCMIEAPGADAVAGANVFDLISDDYREEWRARHARIVAGESMSWEFDIVGLEGTQRHMETHAVPLPLPDGRNAQLAVTRDISLRKQTEEALKESEARLRFLDDLSTATRGETNAEAVMAATTQLLGRHLGVDICAYADVEADEDLFTIRRDWTAPGVPSIVGTYRLDSFGTVAAEAQRSGTPLVIRDNIAELGEEQAATFRSIGITATICLPLVKNGRLAAMMAVHCAQRRDWSAAEVALVGEVTERCWAHVERVGAEAELREAEARFRELADHINQFAWTADRTGWIHWYNRRWYDYTGTTLEQMQGWGWKDVHHPDHVDRVVRSFSDAIAQGTPWEDSFPLRAADGSYRWFLSRAHPIRDEAGEVVRWFGTNTDVNELRAVEQELRLLNETLEQRVAQEVEQRAQAEEALRQAQKMETLGQLTGGVAHDFNNLLQIVSGNIGLIQRNLKEEDTRLRRAADNAARGAERAAVLTQRLLAFSRRQPLAPKPIDPNRLVGGMSELLHRTLGETIEVETVLASGLWNVEVDPHQLENALLNLAINGRDAMEEGGKLTIETANTHLDRAYVSQNAEVPPGQYVAICVSDTGCGMDQDTAARAFEPFFTTKEVGKGTGLGLSMVYGFVKQSGGHLKIYSEPGEGTTVRIYLPRLHGGQQEAEDVDTLPAPEGTRDETILVCEDDDDVRAYTVEVLRDLGYRVIEAHDGPSALRLLERQESTVDLLFTDIVLPSGMTGATLAREAQALRPGLKVLFTTGYARNAIVHHGRLDPGVELITKPFSYTDLAARVRDVLDGISGGAGDRG